MIAAAGRRAFHREMRETSPMDEFIESVATEIGASEQATRAAARAALALLRAHGDHAAVRALVSGLPGATQLLDEEGAGSALGLWLGLRGRPLEDRLADATESLAALLSSGLSEDQLGTFVTALLELGRDRVGAGVVDGALEAVPELEALLP